MTAAESRLRLFWEKVLRWARSRSPHAPALTLRVDCGLTQKHRQSSPRAYMHTLHLPGKVCVSSEACTLSPAHLVGLYLHELGHPMATKVYGRSEQEDADRAVKEFLGVTIRYKGPLLLEWVSPAAVKKILGAR